MYADDLVVVAEHQEELPRALGEWKELFKIHGQMMSLYNIEVMWVGHKERT